MREISVAFLNGSITASERNGSIVEVHISRIPPKRGQKGSRLKCDLERYLKGIPVDFKDYKIDFDGYTDFQRRVLKATRAIPFGQTKTYGEVAKAAGSPGAARAVGQVMAQNRTCILIPCHRVVASGGLGGFTGGVHYKIELLNLEGSLGKFNYKAKTRSSYTRSK